MFLLEEDKALREKLQGMVVEDQKSGSPTRQVGVWFGQPDQEIRTQSYPYITIDMLGVTRDTEREMRGLVAPEYLEPTGYDPETQRWFVEMPIPVTIDYQITTYARHPRHDRAIISQLLHSNLLLRFGYLEIPYTTNDVSGVVYRRLDVMGVSKRDVTEQAKRLFVNAITVRVSSEIAQNVLRTVEQVRQVDINLYDTTIGLNGAQTYSDWIRPV
ncbi:hypothetical protein UFOVP221_98 [uncultured Caudovirales phage]|uniref:Uncharacterized protein n=1 Tax=uncultured Caudovirales phage TaxID=2100421 RepID=A0A6J7WPA6_9CAUD|nr:hypothetical protein UFOVP221_98 [uncultured Caudovirales phage]